MHLRISHRLGLLQRHSCSALASLSRAVSTTADPSTDVNAPEAGQRGHSGDRHRRHQRRRGNKRVSMVDVAQREGDVDVERHFHGAMAHIKAPATLPGDVADALFTKSIQDDTNHFNVDGVAKPEHRNKRAGYQNPNESSRSFFDEGGIDVRGRVQTRERDSEANDRSNSAADILNLSGGSSKRHHHQIDVNRSTESLSPSDPTVVEEAEGAYRDTPSQLTDMLKERLLELKGEKLNDLRQSTLLRPRLARATTPSPRRDAPSGTVTPVNPSSTARRQSDDLRSSSSSSMTLADMADASVGSKRGSDDADAWNLTSSRIRSYLDERHETVLGHMPSRSQQGSGQQRRLSATHVAEDDPASTMVDPFAFAVSTSRAAAGQAAHLQATSAHTSYLTGGSADQAEAEDISATAAARQRESVDGRVLLLRTLQRVGLCSRREAITLITSGEVMVDGVVERNPFRLVSAEQNLSVKGHSQRLRFSPSRMWVYHKPANVMVSRSDPAGRALFVKHAMMLGMDHLIPIGGLPLRAHGIMLLTNDGELAKVMQHPSNMIQQTYQFRVKPAVDPLLAERWNTQGVSINGVTYKNAEFFVNHSARSRYHVKVKIRGESIPAHQLLAHLGRHVQRGGRESFGPFTLHGLAPGGTREVSIPPFYMKYSGSVWKSFVERDWPYFRRLRVLKLRRLAKYRALSAKELEELDTFSFDEVREALQYQSSELEAEAKRFAEQLERQPHVDDTPLDTFPGHVQNVGGEASDSTIEEITDDDFMTLNPFEDQSVVLEDITEQQR